MIYTLNMNGLTGHTRGKASLPELQKLYEHTKNELVMLSVITTAMMKSLDLDQVIYTILTALTSHEGLGFDRAVFFMVDDEETNLEGKMGIGMRSSLKADRIWKGLEKGAMSIESLTTGYNDFRADPESSLNSAVKDISIPLREDMGILARTILEGMPFEIRDERSKALVNKDLKDKLGTDLFATVPLKSMERTLGAILVDNIYSQRPITREDLRILFMFTDHAALAIENSSLYQKTVHLSRTDWLTGLWNTRYFYETLEKRISVNAPVPGFSVTLLDIDNFKRYNDTFGHPAGDEAIRKIASILRESSRKEDFVCRYGGEEFCLIMKSAGENQAFMIAERFRKAVAARFSAGGDVPEEGRLTVSVGIAPYTEGASGRDIVRKADLALYRAKKAGKNRTCIYSTGAEQVLPPTPGGVPG